MAVHSNSVILLTRPRAAAEDFAATLPGAKVVVQPLMEIVAAGEAPDLARYSGLILTSRSAVPFLPKLRLPAYCVGPQTAAVAERAGFLAEVLGENADALTDALLTRRPPGPLLHAHGAHVRGDISGALTRDGIRTDSLVVYDQRAVDPGGGFRALLRLEHLVVPLFSPRSALLFARAAPQIRPDTQLIAFSAQVQAALPEKWRNQTIVLPRPDADLMRDLVLGDRAGRISP